MARTNRAEWAKRVQRWRDSGLTAKEFGAEIGVKASTLSFWKWKLSSEQSAGGAVSRQRTKGAATRGRRAGAVASTRSAAFVEVCARSVSAPATIELVLAGGVSVRVSPDFDEVTLTRLVRAVEAAR